MIKSNVVIQTAFLGDLILSVPVLKRIKKIFPSENLTLICKKGLGDFFVQEGIVDEALEIEKSDGASYRHCLEELNRRPISKVFCLHRSLRSQFFAAQIRADKKIGFSSITGFWIFDEKADYLTNAPEAIRQFKILETTDAESFSLLNSEDYAELNIPGTDGRLPPVPDFFSFQTQPNPLRQGPKKVAVFPGSVWATKKWTTEGFRELAQLLVKQNVQVDLMGAETEKQLCEEIAAGLAGVGVLAGKFSVTESVRALWNYDLVIANDSAPTHMAAYAGTPVITIFGPTVLSQGFRPWSNNSYIVEESGLDCRPCGRHGHQKCPLQHHHCMKHIGAGKVFQLAQKILAS